MAPCDVGLPAPAPRGTFVDMRRSSAPSLALVCLLGCNGEPKPTSAPAISAPASSTAAPSTSVASALSSAAAPLDVPRLPSRAEAVHPLEQAIRLLAPLHAKLRPPGPDDWLASHPESGQSFADYRGGFPALPDLVAGAGKRRALVIQPLGPFGAGERRMVLRAAAFMERFFGLPVRIAPDLGLELVPAAARRKRAGGEQLLTSFVLNRLLAPRLPADAAAYISFTASDLWPGAGWNYVFGEASLGDRVGVWSMHRHGDPEGSAEIRRRALLRTLRTAVHETGHIFSLEHCTAYACVMNGVNNLEESDRTPLHLCPECLAKIAWATLVEPAARCRALAELTEADGLADEAAFYRRSAAALAER